MSFDRDKFRDEVKARTDLAEWIRNDGIPLTGSGREFKACCPFHMEHTPSFTVFHKDGAWSFYCHGCAMGGDIFEYVMRRKGLGFPQALKLVANACGMAMPEPRVYQPREVREAAAPVDLKPFNPDKFKKIDASSRAVKYLVEERKLPLDVLARYSVGQTDDGDAYAFAYKWWPPGVPRKEGDKPRFEFCKVVRVDRPEGKKVEWREPRGGKNILFGMLAVPPEATTLVIAEGEIDAMTWSMTGVPAVSVPGGAGYLGWIQVCWEWLERFKEIHVSFDEDKAGRLKIVEVVNRLGMARTDIVRLPEREGT